MTIIIEDRAAVLDTIKLDHGKHGTFDQGHCAMEVVAWLAGEGHTDAPQCASPVLRRFTIGLNDSWNAEQRQALIPFLPRMVGTAGDGKDITRAFMLADWACREVLPAMYDALGKPDLAEQLRVLEPVTNRETALAAKDKSREIRKTYAADAYAADADAADAAAYAAYAADAADAADADVRETLRKSALELLDRLIDPEA